MSPAFQFALFLHVVSGFLALVIAPVALSVLKGGRVHRVTGKMYFIAILVVSVTALFMAVWKGYTFLVMVGVFSFYLAASGYRALYRKQMNTLCDLKLSDWLLLVITGIISLGMIGYALLIFNREGSAAFGLVPLLFGAIGTLSVISQFRTFTVPGHHAINWKYHHIGGMVGSYIATVSAFSVVNLEFLPGLVRWLWPTLAGVPLLIYLIRKQRARANPAG